jgi:hypothetical protein
VKRTAALFLTVIASLALAVPAVASATTGLTEGGTLVPVGTELIATNIGSIIQTTSKAGNLTCRSVKIAAKLEANSTAEVRASGTGAGVSTATECSVSSGAAVIFSEIKLYKFQTAGEVISGSTKKITFNMSFKETIGSLVCSYSIASGIATYTASSSVFTISEQPMSVTPAACGTTSKLDGQFSLSTTSGSALVLD